MINHLIQGANLAFRYPRSGGPVFVGLNFEIVRGLTYIIGRNGSGKSTLLQVIAGGLKPTSGSLQIGDHLAQQEDLFRSVGYVPQVVRAAGNLTVREQVELNGWLKGLSTREAAGRSIEVLERVGLADLASEFARHLSGGQLARLGIAQALVFNPKVLLLDETLAAIDPIEQIGCASLLDNLAHEIAVVETTHDLKKLHREAHLMVLNAGKKIFDAHVSDFLADIDSPELALIKLVSEQEV